MVAIFCRMEDRRELQLFPTKEFVFVQTERDLSGRKFTGIIRMYDWQSDRNRENCYHLLLALQPELNEKS